MWKRVNEGLEERSELPRTAQLMSPRQDLNPGLPDSEALLFAPCHMIILQFPPIPNCSSLLIQEALPEGFSSLLYDLQASRADPPPCQPIPHLYCLGVSKAQAVLPICDPYIQHSTRQSQPQETRDSSDRGNSGPRRG